MCGHLIFWWSLSLMPIETLSFASVLSYIYIELHHSVHWADLEWCSSQHWCKTDVLLCSISITSMLQLFKVVPQWLHSLTSSIYLLCIYCKHVSIHISSDQILFPASTVVFESIDPCDTWNRWYGSKFKFAWEDERTYRWSSSFSKWPTVHFASLNDGLPLWWVVTASQQCWVSCWSTSNSRAQKRWLCWVILSTLHKWRHVQGSWSVWLFL